MSIADNVNCLKQDVNSVLNRLGRGFDDVTIVAVTKTQSEAAIEAVIKAGISNIGENKVQEAMRKLPMLGVKPDGFHFIGHLQSNKINQLLSLKPCLIHSVDSVYLAQKLHLALGRSNRVQNILIQINSSQEESKSGFELSEAEEAIYQIASFSSLRIKGLMTIGKLDEPEVSRPLFREMKKLFDYLNIQFCGNREIANPIHNPGVEMKYLSMGMSHDYAIALEEGSNLIRIGTALFGERYKGGCS